MEGPFVLYITNLIGGKIKKDYILPCIISRIVILYLYTLMIDNLMTLWKDDDL